jgi:hypothetical protein
MIVLPVTLVTVDVKQQKHSHMRPVVFQQSIMVNTGCKQVIQKYPQQ